MDTINIPCPKCGRELKLRDRSLLGRKGKCPKCGHAFVMEEPVVQLELAEPEPRAVGRWLPESGLATAPRPVAPAPQKEQAASPAPEPMALAALSNLGEDEAASARLKSLKKKNAKRRNIGLAIGAVVVLAAGGGLIYALANNPEKPRFVKGQPSDPEKSDVPEKSVKEPNPVAQAATDSPTKGEKIELRYIPFGAQVILNIRPAELWQKESSGEELRFCLTPLAKLLEMKFEEYFKRKPEQIEEAQICLIPGQQGTLPEVAAVIHLVEEAKKSQLLDDIGGQLINDYDYPVYINGDRAYLIGNPQTVAMCPKAQASEMATAAARPNPASDGIDELLPTTDRDRHITLIFVPRAIRLHSSWWFPENLKPFVLKSCDWFGDEIESASWSFHLGEKTFYSDLHMRNVTGITAANLRRQTATKLNDLPKELLDTVRMMDPRELGKRKIIGRLPKMSQAFAMASTVNIVNPRQVQVVTPLPERAAPNLALGTLLAWDESTRTDFTKARPKTTTDDTKLPDKIADRLKLKLDVDFRRTPLQEAFGFISGELKTTIDIDGDALKAGGFTKNMPQTFQAEKVTALAAIGMILGNYQDPQKPSNTMVIVVDEAKKVITVTTKAFADQQKLTTYDVPLPPKKS